MPVLGLPIIVPIDLPQMDRMEEVSRCDNAFYLFIYIFLFIHTIIIHSSYSCIALLSKLALKNERTNKVRDQLS